MVMPHQRAQRRAKGGAPSAPSAPRAGPLRSNAEEESVYAQRGANTLYALLGFFQALWARIAKAFGFVAILDSVDPERRTDKAGNRGARRASQHQEKKQKRTRMQNSKGAKNMFIKP